MLAERVHTAEPELDDTPPQQSGVRVRRGAAGAEVRPLDGRPARVSSYALFMEHAHITGVSTLPLVMTIAIGVGSAMVLQTTMAPTPPSTELGRMLVVVVMRELAPLFTAIIIAGQWGRALSMDLRSGRPLDMARWPRITGTAVACTALAVHFAIVGMLGAYGTSQAITVRTFDAVRAGFHMELAWFDLPLFVFKTGGLGAIVAWLGSREAQHAATPSDVAEAASRVFVRALVLGGMFSIGLTMVVYALVGPPLPP
jgi:phospholipid/cholesterol/gamma-HCH transport system permease protein